MSTAAKEYEDVFGAEALTDLLFLEDKSYISSLTSLETLRGDGTTVTLGITGHDFRDIHYVRNADDELVTVDDDIDAALDSAEGKTYDLAVHVLVLHTSNVRYPVIIVASTQPLSDAEKSKGTVATNLSMPVGKGYDIDDFLEAFYDDDATSSSLVDGEDGGGDGGGRRRQLRWWRSRCNAWCHFNRMKRSYNNAMKNVRSAQRQASSWKSYARRSIYKARSQLNSVKNRMTGVIRNAGSFVNRARSDITRLPSSLMDKVKEKVEPLSQLSGCDMIKLMEDQINDFLKKKPLCISPGCSGSHLNSGEVETVHEDPAYGYTVGIKTDLKACFQLYGLELDCAGLDKAMNEFWAENELATSINQAIADNQLIKNVRNSVDRIKSTLDSFSVGRRLLSLSEEGEGRSLLESLHEEAYAGIDADDLAEEIHQATKKDVGDRLAAFMRRRRLAEKPGEIIKIKKLRGRTTVDIATHVEITAAASEEWSRDFAEELGNLGIDDVRPIPGTLGLVTVETEALMEVKAPVVVSIGGEATATADLQVMGMTIDQDFYEPASDALVTSGDSSGSKVSVQGHVAVSAAIQAEIKTHASFKICFAGVCAGLAADAMIDTATGADSAITTTVGGVGSWNLDSYHTKYAKYTDEHKKKYNDAVATSGGGVVAGGGAWLYVTMPYMKLYPQIGADVGDATCALEIDNLFEFKPTTSLKDDLKSSQKYDHPYGEYLIRTAIVEFKVLTTSTNGGEIPVSIPSFKSPATWNGVLPDISTTGRRHRHLLAIASSSVTKGASGVQCTEYNGGHPTEFIGSIPSARVSCGDGVLHGADGVSLGPLCWSADCCHGHAVRTSWSRVQCVPGNLAKTIKAGNALP